MAKKKNAELKSAEKAATRAHKGLMKSMANIQKITAKLEGFSPASVASTTKAEALTKKLDDMMTGLDTALDLWREALDTLSTAQVEAVEE
jgi:hypothetical protein